MGLLAQHAYGKSTKISVGLENNFLSGVVLSPKGEKPEKLKEFIDELNFRNATVYFDPQFYMCAFEGSVSLGKLENMTFGVEMRLRRNIYQFLKIYEKLYLDILIIRLA